MCEICQSTPCLSRCPNYDEGQDVAFECDACKEPIMVGEEYYCVGGVNVCDFCISDYKETAEKE